MTSGLIQTFASPRRGNETFQLRRMARIFWVRRKLERRGKKNYFILFWMTCWYFFFLPLWTERFYLMGIHREMFRKIDQIQIDCTASQMNRENFSFFFYCLFYDCAITRGVVPLTSSLLISVDGLLQLHGPMVSWIRLVI